MRRGTPAPLRVLLASRARALYSHPNALALPSSHLGPLGSELPSGSNVSIKFGRGSAMRGWDYHRLVRLDTQGGDR